MLGSRYTPGGGIENWGLDRRVLSRLGCGYARRTLGVPVRDLTGGFKCFRASALRAIAAEHGHARRATRSRWSSPTGCCSLGLTVVEVPIRFRERRLGESKMSARIALEAAWKVPALRYGPRRWRPPLQADRPAADAVSSEV